MVESKPRKARSSGGAIARKRVTATSGAAVPAVLPGWMALSDLSTGRGHRTRTNIFDSISTSRFVIWLAAAGLAATLYVGHVYATQQTFEDLHALRKENLWLHLERDRLQGELDHALGPTRIYPKAQALGLREGFEYGPNLKLYQP